MRVLFTDLDGTLLDHDSYDWEPARPALSRLEELGIPVVFATSKTRAEVEFWREHTGNQHPFIVENGGALFVPQNYFPFPLPDSVERDGYDVVEFGESYQQLVFTLRKAAAEAGTAVAGFHQMSEAGIAARCRIPIEQAHLAKQREYDEPFEILNGNPIPYLVKAVERRGKRYTRGGRFHHITGNNDKAAAALQLHEFYQKAYGPVESIAIGDGPNDISLLKAACTAILMPSESLELLRDALPCARIAPEPGPAGWNTAVLALLDQ